LEILDRTTMEDLAEWMVPNERRGREEVRKG